MLNSIVQNILKYTAPGVPDTYQGSEGWDFSFVDPGNRQNIDYHALERALDTTLNAYNSSSIPTLNKLWDNASDGTIKQLTSYLCLQMRTQNEALFTQGSYRALEVEGKYKNHIVAFCRKHEGKYLLVVLPLNTGEIPKKFDWKDTSVILPYYSPLKWENFITTEKSTNGTSILVSDIFKHLPFAMLLGETSNPTRRAGILMHITSLPGAGGVGDFGKEAFDFVDFLHDTEQYIWQTLPLNMGSKETAYSPYSSYSAFACNTLFISPQQLLQDKLIKESDIQAHNNHPQSEVKYEAAEAYKKVLINIAFTQYSKQQPKEVKRQFEEFIQKEHYWLHDFALFAVLKKHHNYQPWNKWTLPYRTRDEQELKKFEAENSNEIEQCKFAQFLVHSHWDSLKQYANKKGIKILGDIPIYISYDSVDVWANPAMFNLNKDLSMKVVAGVPPDYFNANGQLWGMPIFNWENMQQDGFKWWVSRIKKNLQWFDLLRLDHFRGFSAYWEVPAGNETALNGQWVSGPAEKLFDIIQKKFPNMPFIAEDLGKIDKDVFQLRDKYKLPGMNVVQFGFGENMPLLQHVPHKHSYNSLVYTGTHDNNTMKGWFNEEADKATLKRVKKYTGQKLKRKNCHKVFIRQAYASISKISIIPIQDWLGLDEKSRMNFPATPSGNWLWRADKEFMLNEKLKKRIRKTVKRYGRF